MRLGTRVMSKDEIGRFSVDLIQISYWKRFGPTLSEVEETAFRCREQGVPYVIHPVFTPLSETRTGLKEENLKELTTLARMADLGIIVHDETLPDGRRLTGEPLAQYQRTLTLLSNICSCSIENANNTPDIDWFWGEMEGSITLDLGHFEASGIDSVEKVRSLPDEILQRVDYVHLHRKNGEHSGIVDHWPLTEDCREVQALRELLRRKKDFSVILEINEIGRIPESLAIVKKVCR